MRRDAAWIRDRVDVDPNGCWLWTKAVDRDGYGVAHVRPRNMGAHRLSYEIFVGPVPASHEVDHLCFVRRCVNPAHLEAVTHAENNRRKVAHQTPKSHCVQGHEFSEANTYTRWRNGSLRRQCRKCNAASARAYARRIAARIEAAS